MRLMNLDDGGSAGDAWQWWGGNPLAGERPEIGPGARLITWSGWLGEWDASAGGIPEFATWTTAGWDPLWAWCGGVADELRREGGELLLRAHARHVVADPQACLVFLRGCAERGWEGLFGIALDAAGMLTRDMVDRTGEHTERMMEAVAPVSRVVIAAGGRLDAEGGVLACGLADSEIDAEAIIRSVAAAKTAGAEVVSRPGASEAEWVRDAAAVRAMLGTA